MNNITLRQEKEILIPSNYYFLDSILLQNNKIMCLVGKEIKIEFFECLLLVVDEHFQIEQIITGINNVVSLIELSNGKILCLVNHNNDSKIKMLYYSNNSYQLSPGFYYEFPMPDTFSTLFKLSQNRYCIIKSNAILFFSAEDNNTFIGELMELPYDPNIYTNDCTYLQTQIEIEELDKLIIFYNDCIVVFSLINYKCVS